MTPPPDPSVYEAWSLGAQWVGSLAALGSVVVAVIFGIATLANSRRSKDNQQRAALAAAGEEFVTGVRQSVFAANSGVESAHFVVHANGAERWILLNEGPDTAYGVNIAGLTDLDQRRIQEVEETNRTLPEGHTLGFVLVSRFTLSGPANLVVTYRLEPGGSELRTVVVVPAP